MELGSGIKHIIKNQNPLLIYLLHIRIANYKLIRNKTKGGKIYSSCLPLLLDNKPILNFF